MTAPALIRRFVVAFFVASGVWTWIMLATAAVVYGAVTWELAIYFGCFSLAALLYIAPDVIRAGRR